MFTKTAVYGLGQFGFAISRHIAMKYASDDVIKISAYDIDDRVRESIRSSGAQPFHFPGVLLPGKVDVTDDIGTLLCDADLLVLAVPAQTVRENIRRLRPYVREDLALLNVAKALERGTNMTISEVVEQEMAGIGYDIQIAAMGGGMLACEMVADAPLGADIACADIQMADRIRDFLSSDTLRLYSTDDLIGLEYASAIKNVIAIGAGIVEGLGFPDSTKSFYITRASKEGALIGQTIGAKRSTFDGATQCWYGDLILSCVGGTRNKQLGAYIGQGYAVSEALDMLASQHKIAEGYATAEVLHNLAVKKGLELPIMEEIYQVLYRCKAPAEAVSCLMGRPARRI